VKIISLKPHRNVLLLQKLFHVAHGVGAEMENARGEHGIHFLKFLGGREGQAAFAVEQFLQPPVAGTRFAPDDFRRDKIAHFAAITPAFEPVFPTD